MKTARLRDCREAVRFREASPLLVAKEGWEGRLDSEAIISDDVSGAWQTRPHDAQTGQQSQCARFGDSRRLEGQELGTRYLMDLE